MKTIEVENATGTLAGYVESTGDLPVILTRHGSPVAALVAIENADMESVSRACNRKFLDIIERSRTRYQQEGGISSEDLRRELAHD